MNYYTIRIKDENLTQEAALDILNEAKNCRIRDFNFVEHAYLTCSTRGAANISQACIKHNISVENIEVLEEDDKENELSLSDMEELQEIIKEHLLKAMDKVDFEAIIKKYI